MRRCKKLISAILCVGILTTAVSAFGYNYTYDPVSTTITVTEGGAGQNTVIIVKPYDMGEVTVEDINNPQTKVLYKILSKNEPLPFEMMLFEQVGKYKVNMKDGNAEADFVLNIADADMFADLMEAIESSSDFADALSEYPAFGTPYEGAAEILEASEPSNGYTAEALAKAYNLGEGLSLVDDGSVTPAQFFNEYLVYLDDEIAESFEALNNKELTALVNYTDTIGYPNYDVNYAAKCMLVLAKIGVAKNSNEIKEVCLDFIEKYDIDTDDYDDIKKDFYKNKVFDGIMSDRKDIKNDKDLIKSFKENSKKQLRAYKDSLGDDGGAPAGGGGFVRQEDPAQQEVVTPSKIAFSDLEGHWAKENILVMHERGIINGFTDGTFRPEDNVTRAEFVKMLVSALKLEIGGAVQFDDVVPEDWHYAYIATAFNKGIINGVGTGFNPNGAITRQDASAIVYRAVMEGVEADGVIFNDDDQIADYAKVAVSALSAEGIILGSDGYFNPTQNMTRAEAATIIQRILQ